MTNATATKWQSTARAKAVQLSANADSARGRSLRLIDEARDLTARIRDARAALPDLEREAGARSNNPGADEHRRRKVEELRGDIAALERLRDQTQQQFAVATAEGQEAMRLSNESGELLARLGLNIGA